MTLEIAIFLLIPFIGFIVFAGILDYVNAKINQVEKTKKQSYEK